jgi:biopolymer transport protein TolR
MKLTRTKRRSIAEINVVPYIDVMLVLLVIFMITAPLLSQGVTVDLPQASAKALTQERDPIVVSINARGDYYLNISSTPTLPINTEDLSAQVNKTLLTAKQLGQQQHVFVKGDKQVPYDKVVQAMVILQQAGAETVGLMTQNP